MTGADFAVAWWVFWLAMGIVIFCGLIWTFYRLAVWSDDARWREFVSSHAERHDLGAGDQGRTAEAAGR